MKLVDIERAAIEAIIDPIVRDAARYRYLVRKCVEKIRFEVSWNGEPMHPNRFLVLRFSGSDRSDEPLRDIGEYIDEAISMEEIQQ